MERLEVLLATFYESALSPIKSVRQLHDLYDVAS